MPREPEMLCTIGHRCANGWHQEELNAFGDTWLHELHYILNQWAPQMSPTVDWVHVFIRRDPTAYSQFTAIGAPTP